jgi:DNA-binding LacI/PurR family transcriptional regulator
MAIATATNKALLVMVALKNVVSFTGMETKETRVERPVLIDKTGHRVKLITLPDTDVRFAITIMPPQRPPTIREIAEAVGFSKSAVSLALRDDSRMALATRRHIQKIAAELGYQKNAVLAHLMAELRHSRTAVTQANLAIINASPSKPVYDWHTFRDFREGIRRRSSQLGYGIDEFHLYDPVLRPARLLQILRNRNISGLIFIGAQDLSLLNQTHADLWSHFPAATAGLVRTDPPLACAACDHFQTSYEATQIGLRRGYKRPGLVLSLDLDDLTDYRFSGGYYAAIPHLPARCRLPVHRSSPLNQAAFVAWFEQHRPDYIVTAHDVIFQWLEAAGLRVPSEVGLAHLDWHVGLPNWAGMKQDSLAAGSQVVDLVVSQLHANEKGPQHTPMATLVASKWVSGPTLPPLASP